MFNISIPDISDEELLKRYEKVKPVVSFNDKKYYLRDYTLNELKNISYLWNDFKDIEGYTTELVPLEGEDFYCLHKFGYASFFKPSIGEVLSQIDFDNYNIKRNAVAFEIIEKPEFISDFSANSLSRLALKNGYHVSKVRLYQKSDI